MSYIAMVLMSAAPDGTGLKHGKMNRRRMLYRSTRDDKVREVLCLRSEMGESSSVIHVGGGA